MKQHITKEQWMEIEPAQQREIIKTVNDTDELLNIGQMIEFLENTGLIITGREYWEVEAQSNWTADELCDALWEAVKEKLA